MDGPSLPRSIRWRLQLGLLKLPSQSLEETVSLYDLSEYNASLLEEQRGRYRDLVEKHEVVIEYSEHQEEEEVEDSPTPKQKVETTATTQQLDPLTAMVREQEAQEKRRQELDLKYRKERARRKRGIYEGEDGHASGGSSDAAYASHQVIDKDLHRLQPDHHTYHHSRKRLLQQQEQKDDFDVSVKERTARLEEMLQVHAREHPTLGYRQGMHEIASYLLLVIEMDLYDVESAMQSSTTIIDDNNASSLSILDATYLTNDAYIMLERVMESLSPAYDVKQSPSQSSSPMEEMARSVVAQIKTVAADPVLYDTVTSMHCPPELYCTRWIRLMFSREVLGWRNVLLLWDIFMDLVSEEDSIKSMDTARYSRSGVALGAHLELSQVLETTAASLILLQREALLQADPNESIHLLMNIAPLKNIVPLTAMLLSMIKRLQQNGNSESSISTMATAFGQLARDALQQMKPTGESLRKLYNSTTTLSPEVPAQEEQNSAHHHLPEHPLMTQQQVRKEPPPSVTRVSLNEHRESSCLAMSESLKESTSTITDFLMQVKSNGERVPEVVWEALARVESVRQELLRTDN